MQHTNPYNDVKLSQFKMWLHDMADKGEGKFIEVYVDDVKVVPRTNRIESLDDHKVYLDDTTETIKVFTYNTENSNRYQQFTFVIEKKKATEQQVQTQPTQNQQQGLSGIELENKINERLTQSLAQERERWQTDLLKRDFDTCKKDLQDAEEYIEDLEKQLNHYKSKKLHLGDVNLGEVASIVLEGMVKRNPHWVAKLPGGDALAGLIAKEATENGTAEVIENEVVFKKKTPADEGMSEEMKAQLGFLKQLETHFSQVQLDKIMLILQSFVEAPKNIETVFELLEIKTENEKV
jgi:hypothetical protein